MSLRLHLSVCMSVSHYICLYVYMYVGITSYLPIPPCRLPCLPLSFCLSPFSPSFSLAPSLSSSPSLPASLPPSLPPTLTPSLLLPLSLCLLPSLSLPLCLPASPSLPFSLPPLSHSSLFKIDDWFLFSNEECEALTKFVKSLPTYRCSRAKIGGQSLEQPVVNIIEELVQQSKSRPVNSKQQAITVKPELVYKVITWSFTFWFLG